MQPVFRFAPSPNGRLHLGHAFSALLNEQMCKAVHGRLLVRIEDIDTERCTRALADAALEDLRWLGISFEEPVLFQSRRMAHYREAIARLMAMGLLYVCTCSRKTREAIAQGLHDPEGQPVYPGTCRRIAHVFTADSALRLDMARAAALAGSLTWQEKGQVTAADPQVWGDAVIARKMIGTSYHLSVVVDDAAQGVTDVVRGEDLRAATSIHRLLQRLLGLPEPRYHHHALIRHITGRKLAKSMADTNLAQMRADGATAQAVRDLLGFDDTARSEV